MPNEVPIGTGKVKDLGIWCNETVEITTDLHPHFIFVRAIGPSKTAFINRLSVP
jgi:hypothetical protein